MPDDIFVVKVPQLGVNDEIATLVEWYVPDEGSVNAGDPLCALETTKAVFEAEAEYAGSVVHLAAVGNEVRIGQPIGLIGSSLENVRVERESYLQQLPERGATDASIADSVKATKKAARLARELAIDLTAIGVSGIIREEDIRRFAAGSTERTPETSRRISLPTPDEEGFVAPEFLAMITKDSAFAQLSSELKVLLYRTYGACIGNNVKIGQGSVILSQVIRLANDAEIGADCHIKADRFVLGKMSVIGKGAQIATREVIIGDVFFSADNLSVGGGGAFGPRSSLHVGGGCLISANCVLNTGEPISVGNEVGLSPNVQLYTHNHWQSVLEGYAARHAPIVVEDKAYITGNCLVVPGVRVGEGATVLANSVVAADVPPYTVVSGVPARKVGSINRDLTEDQKHRIIGRLMAELAEELEFRGFKPELVKYARTYDFQEPSNAEVVLTFHAVNAPEAFTRPVLFDLTALEVRGQQTRLSDEVRNFLRRRGIRFHPIYWRYGHTPT